MSHIFIKCLNFYKKASDLVIDRVSLVDNKDTLLQELSNLKDYDDRVELAEEHWKKLGTGSSRAVFQISDELIIKIAINEKGMAQCHSEMRPELQRECTVPVILADPEGKWIITHLTETLKKEDFKKTVGVGFDAFSNAFLYAFNNESDDFAIPKEYDKIKNLPLFKCVGDLIVKGSCLAGDLSKLSSWGMKNNQVFVRDFGLTRENYEQFYETKNSKSKSKTSE